MAAEAKTMSDPDFGSLQYRVDAWDGLSPFEFEPSHTTHFAVHILAPESGPTAAQQAVFRELKGRYAQLWPAIAGTIAKCAGIAADVDGLGEVLDPVVGLYMLEDFESPEEAEFELVYDVSQPEARGKACFVRLRPWEIVEAVVAD